MSSLPPNNISIDDITNYLSNIDGNDIKDESITNAKIASGIDGSKINTGTIDSAKLANESITNVKLASGIDGSKITTGTIAIARIGDRSITNAKIADGTITNAKIGYAGIDGSKISNGTINSNKLSGSYANLTGSYDNVWYAKRLRLSNTDNNVWSISDYVSNGTSYLSIKRSFGGGGYISGAGSSTSDMLNFTGQHTTFFINKNVYKGYIVCSIGEFYDNKSFKKNNENRFEKRRPGSRIKD